MKHKNGFSLIELMISLITISCITAAFAPVITKKMSRGILFMNNTTQSYKNLKEFTSEGQHHFIVPEGVTEIEVTLVSGGDGGEAGEATLTKKEIKTIGESNFQVPTYLKNKYAKITMCGGGGGGGGMATNICLGGSFTMYQGAAGGGSGGAIKDKIIKIDNTDSIKVYVGGGGNVVYGGTPDTVAPPNGNVVWTTCADSLEADSSCGAIITAQSAAGGYVVGGLMFYHLGASTGVRRGGFGGTLAGGSGVTYMGNCGLAGGGGGGGNATRFGTYGESHFVMVGGGGGGGGEGMSVDSDLGAPIIRYAGGAGGGGGGVLYGDSSIITSYGGTGGDGHELNYGCAATGGKGGKPDGNDGKDSGCNNGANYGTYRLATSGYGGDSPLAEYPNNCAGGHGHGIDKSYESRSYSNGISGIDNLTYFNDPLNPRNKGRDGIIVLNYISGTKGGKGGNSGKKITKKISVEPGDDIKIIVGAGGQGGSTSELLSDGTTTTRQAPTSGTSSQMYVNDAIKLDTNNSSATFLASETPTNENGTAGGKYYEFSCSAGTSGNSANLIGGNANGYGGCGGGGGYVSAKGGNGSTGYAKIEW